MQTSTKHPADFDSRDCSTGIAKQDFLTVLAISRNRLCPWEKHEKTLASDTDDVCLLLAEGLQRFLVPDSLSFCGRALAPTCQAVSSPAQGKVRKGRSFELSCWLASGNARRRSFDPLLAGRIQLTETSASSKLAGSHLG